MLMMAPKKLTHTGRVLTPTDHSLHGQVYRSLTVNEQGLEWLNTTFGITPRFLLDMQELGFSLAGGAAAALAHILAHDQFPDYVVGDADFFPNGMCPPETALALSPEERGSRLLDVLTDHEFCPSSRLINWALSVQKTERPSTAPFFGGNPWENAEPILMERRLSSTHQPLQIMVNFLTKDDEAVWGNFDFTAVAAVLYASEERIDLVVHDRMLQDYRRRSLRWLTKPLNPIRGFSRVQKYNAKGFTLSKPQLVQWMDWLDEPIEAVDSSKLVWESTITWREAMRGNIDPERVPYQNIPAACIRPALNESELQSPVWVLYRQYHEEKPTLNLP